MSERWMTLRVRLKKTLSHGPQSGDTIEPDFLRHLIAVGEDLEVVGVTPTLPRKGQAMSKRLRTHLSRKMTRNSTADPADRETRTLTRSDLSLIVKWFEGIDRKFGHVMHPAEVAHMREVVRKIKAAG
jgi:hypothetical protein